MFTNSVPSRWAAGYIAAIAVLLAGLPAVAQTGVTHTVRSVSAGGRSYKCNVVTIDLRGGHIVPRVIIAKDGVGKTESFTSMLNRTHAVAAINGSFFDAYNTVGDKDPGMTLICNGDLVHKGGGGTVIGFGPKGVVMGRLDLPIRGKVTVPGRATEGWYAYWINRTPTSAANIAIFTPARGARVRVSDGISVVVRNSLVTRVAPGDVPIPNDGFVVHFRGDQAPESAKFPIGAFVEYTVARMSEHDAEAWDAVTEAVGAGPRLLTDGRLSLDPQSEGFVDAKILTNGGRRSAIGLTQDGKIIIITVDGPTINTLASIMRELGAYQAMNLDGGASSALFANGETITAAGRDLSNALVFVRR